jgi:hypothetical protein
MRAALYIARRYGGEPPEEIHFLELARDQITDKLEFAENTIDPKLEDDRSVREVRREIQVRMSDCSAHIRDPEKVQEAILSAWALLRKVRSETKIPSADRLPEAFENLDLCLTHVLYLEAIGEYLRRGGQSRGSYLVLNPEGEMPCEELGAEWKFHLNEPDAFVNAKILEVSLDTEGKVVKEWVDIRPIPQEDTWFENVWSRYRDDEIIG